MNKQSILFLLPYPLKKAPSQRFRVEAFFSLLQQHHIGYRTHCFLTEKSWNGLYTNGAVIQKAWAVVSGYFKRLWVVFFMAPKHQYVFIHREAAPLGPPVFEWLLAKVFRKRIIYDFDDAIWIPSITDNNKAAAFAKCFWKIKYCCKWAYKISAGNNFLASFAHQYNKNVTVLPTCVDTALRFNTIKNQNSGRITIGWTGSHSTLPYLNTIVPVLQQLEQQYDFAFLVICNQPPPFDLRSLVYKPWSEAAEIEDLLQMHIGLMPLQHDAWSEGKCGFKIIQYLALGIPAVASPVGVNKNIVEDGCNGFLCNNQEQWLTALQLLLQDAGLREKLGNAGRQKIIAHYSIQAHGTGFLSLFD